MKIAVTYENGQVFQHFGHTAQFKLYQVEDGQVLSSQVVDTNGSGHGALAGFLQAQGVDTLLCGGIGGGAKTALAQAGIQLYGGVTGSADGPTEVIVSDSESLSGAGIAGEIDSPTLGMTESMTLKMSFNSVYPEIYNMLDWTRSNLFECYAAVQMSDPATSMRTSVPLRVNIVGRAKSFPLGSLEPGKKQGNEQELEVTRLEVLLDGEEKLLIDKLNFIHRVHGTDLLATVRAQMGLNV